MPGWLELSKSRLLCRDSGQSSESSGRPTKDGMNPPRGVFIEQFGSPPHSEQFPFPLTSGEVLKLSRAVP